MIKSNVKLDKKTALEIAGEFLKTELSKEDWYLKIQPYTKAILLYGSTAKGTNRPDSDIDLLIIVPLEIEKKYTTGEYFFNFRGREINIVLRSVEKMRKIAEEKDAFQKTVFDKSEIIWQKDDEVSGLIKKITA